MTRCEIERGMKGLLPEAAHSMSKLQHQQRVKQKQQQIPQTETQSEAAVSRG